MRPCVTICPTVALYRRPDGIVDFDGDRCIGCKSCMQACPYDALYIDPETQTAAKCHYCAHRVEVGLEPACVIVCPVAGHRARATSTIPARAIARLVASQQMAVRKPEQGTQPKLFYLGADEAALTPAHAGARRPVSLRRGEPHSRAGRVQRRAGVGCAVGDDGDRSLAHGAHGLRRGASRAALGVEGLDVSLDQVDRGGRAAHRGHRDDRRVVGRGTGGDSRRLDQPGLSRATPCSSDFDLKRPERFLYLLFKPNWRSWLVWGGWILIASGVLASLWLAAGWDGRAPGCAPGAGGPTARPRHRRATAPFSSARPKGATSGKARSCLPHLIRRGRDRRQCASLLLAGAVALSGELATWPRASPGRSRLPGWSCAPPSSSAELFDDSIRATMPPGPRGLIRRGTIPRAVLGGVVLGGVVASADPALASGAAVAAGAGRLSWPWGPLALGRLWVRAGQALPLS